MIAPRSLAASSVKSYWHQGQQRLVCEVIFQVHPRPLKAGASSHDHLWREQASTTAGDGSKHPRPQIHDHWRRGASIHDHWWREQASTTTVRHVFCAKHQSPQRRGLRRRNSTNVNSGNACEITVAAGTTTASSVKSYCRHGQQLRGL